MKAHRRGTTTSRQFGQNDIEIYDGGTTKPVAVAVGILNILIVLDDDGKYSEEPARRVKRRAVLRRCYRERAFNRKDNEAASCCPGRRNTRSFYSVYNRRQLEESLPPVRP